MANEFPPNSHSEREARPARTTEKAPAKKEVVRVTKNKAVLRKKPLRRKFIDAFRPEDNVGFVEHMLIDTLVPSIKDAVADASSEMIYNLLGTSGVGRRSRRRSSGGGYTSYNRMSSGRSRGRRDRDDDDRRGRRDRDDRRDRPADDAREVVLDTRVEAEEVLDSLIELASKYDFATMRDLLSLIGEPHNPTHEDWGWSDLRGARIHPVGRDGYLLDLPRPEYLD